MGCRPRCHVSTLLQRTTSTAAHLVKTRRRCTSSHISSSSHVTPYMHMHPSHIHAATVRMTGQLDDGRKSYSHHWPCRKYTRARTYMHARIHTRARTHTHAHTCTHTHTHTHTNTHTHTHTHTHRKDEASSLRYSANFWQSWMSLRSSHRRMSNDSSFSALLTAHRAIRDAVASWSKDDATSIHPCGPSLFSDELADGVSGICMRAERCVS